MAPKRTGNVALYTRLREPDLAILARAKAQHGTRSLSSVLKAALVTLLETPELRRDGLRIPTRIGRPVPRSYRVAPRTRQLLRATSAELGYSPQDLLRAASPASTGKSARERRKPAAAPAAVLAQSTGTMRCGTKRTCGQMGSYQEARFHLSQCGLDRLDGDSDGVPCETICR